LRDIEKFSITVWTAWCNGKIENIVLVDFNCIEICKTRIISRSTESSCWIYLRCSSHIMTSWSIRFSWCVSKNSICPSEGAINLWIWILWAFVSLEWQLSNKCVGCIRRNKELLNLEIQRFNWNWKILDINCLCGWFYSIVLTISFERYLIVSCEIASKHNSVLRINCYNIVI
jgi:hypothetical protein